MTVFRFVLAGVAGGSLFAILDGLINGNPLAARLLAYLKPVARDRVNIAAGVAIDLLWGFAMTGVFLLIRGGLPGGTGVVRGLCLGVLAWFFRVAMGAAGETVMVRVPASATIYRLAAGAVQMLALGALLGLLLG